MEDWEFEADIALRLRCMQLAVELAPHPFDENLNAVADQIFKWVTRITEDEPTS